MIKKQAFSSESSKLKNERPKLLNNNDKKTGLGAMPKPVFCSLFFEMSM